MSIEDQYVFTSAEDSVKEKDWAAGSSKRLDSEECIIRLNESYIPGTDVGITEKYHAVFTTIKYPPALWKIVDETIVNALDHIVRCYGKTQQVSMIKLTFERNGWIKVTNDGPGIDVEVHKVATAKLGKETMVPTLIFGHLFQGSNRVKSNPLIGGENGFGAKLANIMSDVFILETVDGMRNLHFTQMWKNGMKECEPPVVIGLNTQAAKAIPEERRKPHTTLAYLPNYKFFGYTLTKDNMLTEADFRDLTDLFRTRMIFASTYAHFTANPPKVGKTGKNVSKKKKSLMQVYFNNELLDFHTIEDVAQVMFPDAERLFTVLTPSEEVVKVKTTKTGKPAKAKPALANTWPMIYPWEVCIVITAANVSELSVVNGIVVKSGKHTKYLREHITDSVKTSISKMFNEKEVKFSSSFVSNNMFILANTKIPAPSWTGQRKDNLDYDTKRFKVYQFAPGPLKSLTGLLQERISVEILGKVPTATGRKKQIIDYEKYRKAELAGTKHGSECMLIVVEGDSAMNRLKVGITESVGYDRIGLISSGGVIMNARTKSSVVQTENGGQYIAKSNQLENNKFFKAFCAIVGLQPHYRYDPKSPTYKKEIAELRYGSVCMFVDQDLDGKGNILGSLLSTAEYWWPELLKAKFFKWFCSPIIRAYPTRGGKIVEFFSIPEYNAWMVSRGLSADSKPTGYTLQYYKGIGTHSREETISMFKKYQNNILTYTVDDRTSALFNIYFGNDPDLRKAELSTPVETPNPEQVLAQFQTRLISCSDHLLWETKPYQIDNIERKLDHIIDGQNQSGRKILDGILKAFNAANSPIKVAVLAGFISETENYHHGEASLADSITGKGFIGPGGKQLPQLDPQSNFGSMAQGGKDASPPRYIFAKENRALNSLLYPDADYHILEFNFDEGVRSEPKYFVPIIPVAACESTDIPAHGWKITTWARDVFDVIANVRRMIRLGGDCELIPMQPATYKGSPYHWPGTFRNVRGNPHTFGSYVIAPDNSYIIITCLPLRTWTDPYVERLIEKAKTPLGMKIISDPAGITDSSNDRNVSIKVPLVSGAIELLEDMGDSAYTTGIEEWFGLRDRMVDHLNFMNLDGSVTTLKSYGDILYRWFPVRVKFYAKRIDRQVVILKLKILRMENIIRYVRAVEMRLATRKIDVMRTMLTEANYLRICADVLSSPKFTPTEELEAIILRSDRASHDYLLDLSDKAKSEEKLVEYEATLDKLRAELNELETLASQGKFRGAAIMERELNELEAVIKEGFRTAWKFGDFGKYTFE